MTKHEGVTKFEQEVKEALEQDSGPKDSDNILYYFIIKNRGYDPEGLSAKMMLQHIERGLLPPIESIIRIRRKLQSKHPELRGDKYHQRQRTSERIKEEMKEEQ